MGEQEGEERRNNLWITSLWVNIKALCLFFIISQRHWAPAREASYTWTASHPNYKLNRNWPIFRLKIYCNLKTRQYLRSPCVCLFFREVLVEQSFADETTAYTQGEEPVICLNMSLRIVVVITNRAVITGITVSLTSIPWQWFGSPWQGGWDHWWQQWLDDGW